MANDVLERMRSGATRREAEARKAAAKVRAAERVEQDKRNREHASHAKAEAEAQRAEHAARERAEAAERNRAPAPPKPAPVSALEVELSPNDIAGKRMREFATALGQTRNRQAAELLARNHK